MVVTRPCLYDARRRGAPGLALVGKFNTMRALYMCGVDSCAGNGPLCDDSLYRELISRSVHRK
jgi:hypothetical protein